MANDLRARQRTFEAAYWRSSLGQFYFSLIILKLFQSEFYSIGCSASQNETNLLVCYAIFGLVMILVAEFRRVQSNNQFFVDAHGRYFKTSGRVVVLTAFFSLALYITLLYLLLSRQV
jgi:hypothetical protein